MKLKLVVASMSVLGLVSCPVFAATTTTKHTKHHHVFKRHHEVREVETAPINYKGEVPPVEVCSVSQAQLVYDIMGQNFGRAMPNPCNPAWFNRISWSGGVNVDLGKFGNRSVGYMGENYRRVSLNDAYLNIGAVVNDWTKAFVSISYDDATTVTTTSYVGAYSSAYSNGALSLEQGYVTFANFDVSPFFLQVGKQFQDFGRYELHPITRSMTQVMSETLATSLKVGFIAGGFNGSAYVFDDELNQVGKSARTNGGVAIGYEQVSDQLGFDLGLGWIYNLMGVNDVAFAVSDYNSGTYHSHKGGLSLYGDVNSGPFSLSGRYTTAIKRFNPLDLPSDGQADVVSGTVVSSASGAKPYAWGLQAGYGFQAFGSKNNNVYLGYQQSHQAAGLDLPKSRWELGYGLEWWKNTNFGIQWDHDKGYSTSHGGNNRSTNLVSLRTGVKFG